MDTQADLPAGWKWSTLADSAEVLTDGNWIETKDQSDDGIRLVQTGNVGVGVFKDRRDKARFISEETFQRLKCFEVLPQDILISRLPDPVGRACIIPDTGDKMITAVDCSIVRTKANRVDPQFLVHYSETRKYLRDVDELCTGTTRRRISRKNLAKTPIPLPPLEEQKRIVAVLDQAFTALDRARAHAEANLSDAGELFQAFKASLMEHPEGDTREVNLAEITSIESKLVDPREPSYLDLPHLGAGNMITGSDELVDIQTAREEKLKSGKHPFDAQTVLYSKIRPYLMKVARPDFDGLCSADVYPLTPSAELDRNYLFHLLLSPNFTEYAISGSDRAGMPKVNRTHLFAYTFDLPDIDVQRNIAARIDTAMKLRQSLKDQIETKLADLADLRQSLLQKAFSGQL